MPLTDKELEYTEKLKEKTLKSEYDILLREEINDMGIANLTIRGYLKMFAIAKDGVSIAKSKQNIDHDKVGVTFTEAGWHYISVVTSEEYKQLKNSLFGQIFMNIGKEENHYADISAPSKL